MRRLGLFALAVLAMSTVAQAQSADDLFKMGDEFDAMDREALVDQIARAQSCTAARDLDCGEAAVAKAAKLAHSVSERDRVRNARQGIADERAEIRREELAVAQAEREARDAEERATRLAQQQEFNERMAQQQQEQPASLAQGILEGFNSAMAGKARIDAIHNDMIARLQQGYAARAAQQQQQQQSVSSGPSRQVLEARQSAADARERAAQLRQQQSNRPSSGGQAYAAPSSPPRAATALTAAQQAQDRELLAMEQRARARPASAPANAPVKSYVSESYVEPPRKKLDTPEGQVDDTCHLALDFISTVYDNYAKRVMAGQEAVFKNQLISGPDNNVGGRDSRLGKALFSSEFDRVASGTYRSKQAAVDGYFRACLQSPYARSVEAYYREYFRQQVEKHGTKGSP